MKSFANDPSLDRVLLISREEMGGAAGGFDPLHPVYTQTEGADPFTAMTSATCAFWPMAPWS